jgi:hypothetical protein
MQSETTFKTLKVVHVLYRHMAEDDCRHSYSYIVRQALGRNALKNKSDGLAARSQQPTDAAPQEVNLNGNYRDRINS